jgi:hypothetical protein
MHKQPKVLNKESSGKSCLVSKKERRGGAREGAGRPRIEGEKASEGVNFRLKPSEVKALIDRYSEEGDTIHKICQRLAREAL